MTQNAQAVGSADSTQAAGIAAEATIAGITPDPNDAKKKPEHLGFFAHFLILNDAMRELWIVFAMKLLGTIAYSVMATTLVLWLSSDLGYDDKHAGYWAAMWSTVMTLITVMVGSLTDAMGIRKAFLIGVVICIGARFVMTAMTIKWMVLGLGLFPLAIGEALGTPVLVAATRRYSTTKQRSFAFSVSYAVMNVGFYFAAVIFDSVRAHLGEHGSYTIPGTAIHLTTYRTLFLISLIVEIILFPILYFGIREGVEAVDENVTPIPPTPDADAEPLPVLPVSPDLKSTGTMGMIRKTLSDTFRIFGGLWKQPGFYKFLAFLGFAAFVRLIFVHLTYTYPKFAIRELGEGSPIAKLSAINSILIIALVPIVGALTAKISAYRMVMVGSVIAASSVFIMTMPPQWFQGLADGWLGHAVAHGYLRLSGSVNPWYVSIFLFILVLSIGEAVYSPRLYEYAAAIAPKGQEGSYMSLSYLPFFMAKLCVTTFSGVLLQKYCPQTGPRNSNQLWMIIALTTSIAPIGLIALRNHIRVHEAGRAD